MGFALFLVAFILWVMFAFGGQSPTDDELCPDINAPEPAEADFDTEETQQVIKFVRD